MVRLVPLVAGLLAAGCHGALVKPSPPENTNPPAAQPDTIRGSYIVELADGQDAASFLRRLEDQVGAGNVSQRLEVSSALFKGVSFTVKGLGGAPHEEATATRIQAMPQVKQMWPVRRVAAPNPKRIWSAKGKKIETKAPLRADSKDSYPPHVMTQVNRLRDMGYTGKGIRIGIIDTGVDYTHPALGGCFGPGCLVEYGYDLVGNSYNGSNAPEPDSDPYDGCVGHGTHVAGIIAAQENPLGFTGAAPAATLGMYRVFGCQGGSASDIVLAGINKAYADGSQIITGSLGVASGWKEDAVAVAVSRIVQAGVPCTFAAGNEVPGTEGAFAISSPASGEGVMAISSFTNTDLPTYDEKTGTVVSVPNPKEGGYASTFTSWGPTFEMEAVPKFGGPGGNILSTFPLTMGGYAVLSGTSMATPSVAGIVALIAEVRGTFNPSLIENLLTMTAKPNILFFYNETTGAPTTSPYLAPSIQQGAGLVQAYDAAFATTVLSVSGLSFGDSDHFAAEQSFTVTNLGKDTVEYALGHSPALSATATWPIYRRSSPELYDTPATLVFDPPRVKMQPGASARVTVRAAPPRGLDAKQLPLYSGWVTLNGTGAGAPPSLSLPYVGAACSMRRDIPVLMSQRMVTSRSDNDSLPPIANGTVFQLPAPPAHADWARPLLTSGNGSTVLAAGVRPVLYSWLVLGTAQVRVEVVPVARWYPGSKDNGLGIRTMGNLPGFPDTYRFPYGWTDEWTGQMADGSWAPAGRFRFLVLALRVMGDPENLADYDQYDSPEFSIRYV